MKKLYEIKLVESVAYEIVETDMPANEREIDFNPGAVRELNDFDGDAYRKSLDTFEYEHDAMQWRLPE